MVRLNSHLWTVSLILSNDPIERGASFFNNYHIGGSRLWWTLVTVDPMEQTVAATTIICCVPVVATVSIYAGWERQLQYHSLRWYEINLMAIKWNPEQWRLTFPKDRRSTPQVACIHCLVFTVCFWAPSTSQPTFLSFLKPFKQGSWDRFTKHRIICKLLQMLFHFHSSKSAFLSTTFILMHNTDTQIKRERSNLFWRTA